MVSIVETVSIELANRFDGLEEEIVAHGIHNLTNDFHGNSDDDYQAFADEFKKQAQEKLDEIENKKFQEFMSIDPNS